MMRELTTIGWRLLLGCAGAYGLWRLMGPSGLVMAAPLFGGLLAGPILEVLSASRRATRELAYADVKGQYFEHRGHRLRVVEDERHHRWVRVADVRRLIPRLPSNGALRAQFPEGLRDEAAAVGTVMHADALLLYLEKSTEPESVKFKNWLARDVVRPAATIRDRLGIHDPVPGARPGPGPEGP